MMLCLWSMSMETSIYGLLMFYRWDQCYCVNMCTSFSAEFLSYWHQTDSGPHQKHSRAICILVLHWKEIVTHCLYNIASHSFCPWWLEGAQQALIGKGSFISCQCHDTPVGDGQVLLGWLPWPPWGPLCDWKEWHWHPGQQRQLFSVCYKVLCNSGRS